MKEAIDDYCRFLRFPSVSAKPENKEACVLCAQWVSEYLAQANLEVSIWETSQNPIVFAEKVSAEPKGTLLFYIHYDVQPEEPLELWKSDPFEPKIEGDTVYARGASDNKGQAFYTMWAIKELLGKQGSLPINLKIVVDGNEETGSRGLADIAAQKKSALQADWVVIVDVEIPELDKPAVTIGMRGITQIKVKVVGADRDLHSGGYGGIVDNAARAMLCMLSTLWNSDGQIIVEGFYDDIEEMSQEELNQLGNPIDYQKQLKEIGARRVIDGDHRIQNWLMPTLEVNGLSSGFIGKEVKTIIPAAAKAALSCRLVPGQDPKKMTDAVIKHLKKNVAKGFDLEIELGHGAKAYRAGVQSKLAVSAQKAYTKALGKPCGLILCGASIPIGPLLHEVAGGEMIGIGVALASDEIHAPNEHFDLNRLQLGRRVIECLIQELGAQ